METIESFLSPFWAILTFIYERLKEFVPMALRFMLWVICGILVLPCIYVAGNLYPRWVEWGEKMQ